MKAKTCGRSDPGARIGKAISVVGSYSNCKLDGIGGLEGRIQVKIPGKPNEGAGGIELAEVLKLKTDAFSGLCFDVVMLLLRQSDSSAAPVWHVLRVSLIDPSSDVTVRWNGAEVWL